MGDSTGSVAVCGDGMVTGDEVCDDGVNDDSYGGCASDCLGFGPYCGDGVVEEGAGEACDDANRTAGDGCNPDCVVSGTQLSCATYDTPLDGGTVSHVAIDDDGTVYIAGGEQGPGGFLDTRVWVRRLAADDTEQWVESWDDAPNTLTAIGGLAAGAGLVSIVGTSDIRDIFVATFDENGTLQWDDVEFALSGLSYITAGRGVAIDSDGNVYAAGGWPQAQSTFASLWLRRYSSSGSIAWTDVVVPSGVDRPGGLALVTGGLIFSGRMADGGVWVRRYGTDGNPIWTETADIPGVPAVATDSMDNSILAAIPQGGGTRLRSLDLNGNEQWTTIDAGFELAGHCISPDDTIVEVGYVDLMPDVPHLRKLDTAGNEVWAVQISPNPNAPEAGMGGCAVAPDGTILAVGGYADADVAVPFVCRYAP